MAKSIKCDPAGIRAIKDAMETLNGNWKLPILFSLSGGAKRFKEIAREVQGISDKMLSKNSKTWKQIISSGGTFMTHFHRRFNMKLQNMQKLYMK